MLTRGTAGATGVIVALEPVSKMAADITDGRALGGNLRLIRSPRQRLLARDNVVKGNAGPPDAVLARPLSWASYPVATGRPRPGQPRPRARRVADVKGKRGARKSINLNLNPGGPSRSSSIAPAETINLNPGGPSRLRRARFSSAPTRQGIKRTSPKCRSESTPEPPDAVLARPLSWASYPVATGRPRPGQQRPRARAV
jgi:hypothetical protein